MPFPSQGGSRIPLATALDLAYRLAGTIKNAAAALSADSAAGNVLRQRVHSYCANLVEQDGRLAAVQAQSGIAAYAQSQFDDLGLDIATEFTAMRNAISAVITNIRTTSAVSSGTDIVLEREFDLDGSLILLDYTSAQLVTLRGLLDDLVATID